MPKKSESNKKPAAKKTAEEKTVASSPQAEPTQEQLEAAYTKAVKAYAHRPNVTGVDIGFRYKDQKRLESFGVRIHVKEKIPKTALEADELLPQEIDGVPVDVVQAVYKAHALMAHIEPEGIARKSRLDPVQPGISVSHPNVTSGTIGAVVYDRTTGHRGILSNWHVLVGSANAKPGDPVVQPGRKWGGRVPADRIGRLERFLLDQYGDAAFAILNGVRKVEARQAETDLEIAEARKVKPGEVLEKSGATTAMTRGKVDGVGQYTLDYAVGPRTITGFKITAEKDGNPDGLEISSGGDSGAVWYSPEDKMGVGLHFAGETDTSPIEEHALACHLPDVLDQLSLSLVPVGPIPPPPVQEEEMLLIGSTSSPDLLVIETVARLSRLLEAAYLNAK